MFVTNNQEKIGFSIVFMAGLAYFYMLSLRGTEFFSTIINILNSLK